MNQTCSLEGSLIIFTHDATAIKEIEGDEGVGGTPMYWAGSVRSSEDTGPLCMDYEADRRTENKLERFLFGR